MSRFYVVFSYRRLEKPYDIDFGYTFLDGDTDNMEETIDKWYHILAEKNNEEDITIINWKVL